MGLDDYVIACRSYKRSSVFPYKTYRMLAHNGLTSRLYIFVANHDEKVLYERALKGLEYKQIVIGEIGCAAVVRSICAFFPIGQRIAFMDDDLSRFYCFDANGALDKDSKKLHKYLDDGFTAIDKYNLGAFSFSFLSNKFYLKDKPFKEFRPAPLAGSFFATRNNPKLILTKPYTSHADRKSTFNILISTAASCYIGMLVLKHIMVKKTAVFKHQVKEVIRKIA